MRKRNKLSLFSILIINSIIILELGLNGCAVFIQKPKEGNNISQDADFQKDILKYGKHGYWLLIRGYHSTDHLVAGATLSEYSHAAILDLKNNEIIEATSQGVHELSLE
ncbi:MAG: hypothetical protein JEZ09_17670 [Salinivirgaceae bacterium]|nr:hypothetical protein [Salinivirgaceae bacterium]